jgi:glutamate dehydrogenase
MNELNIAAISDQVQKAMPSGDPGVQLAARFTAALFSGTGEGGVQDALSQDRMIHLALNAFAFFKERPAKTRKLRVYDYDDGGPAGPVTVIEAVNDDMPFLLSSLLAELTRLGLAAHFVAHPIFRVHRDASGELTALVSAQAEQTDQIAPAGAGRAESFVHIQIDPLGSNKDCDDLLERLEAIFDRVRVVVADWMPMVSRLREAIDAYVTLPPPVAVDELAESVQFLKWLADGHFTFLGVREYEFTMRGTEPHLHPKPETGLGLLRDPNLHVLRRTGSDDELSPIAREFFSTQDLLIITKANFLSPVQRHVHTDSIGIKLYSAEGALTGELRLVGLFSASAYNESSRRIPFLRHKVEQVFRKLHYGQNSYSGRVLANLLETFPRDELFQISTDQLTEFAGEAVHLELMPRTRVFVRSDEFGRFASVLVYIMREHFSTKLRQKIIALLERRFEGQMTEFTPVFTVGPLVRLHVVIWKDDGVIPRVAAAGLEEDVRKIVRNWRDDLAELIRERYGRGAGSILKRYGEAFPPGYEYANSAERALVDIEQMEKLTDGTTVGIDFYSNGDAPTRDLRVTLYQLGEPISLSRRVPVLENFGFSVISEQTFEIAPHGFDNGTKIFLHELLLESAGGQPIDLAMHQLRLEDSFLAIWRGEAGDDLFNQLIIQAGLNWREAALMRAYGSYLRQIGAPFGQAYLARTLARHGGIVRDLVLLFHILHDPARGQSIAEREAAAKPILASIEGALDKVSSLDEDRMIRRLLNLIHATLRTNFYRKPTPLAGGASIALKIRSKSVDAMPDPKPFAEIFVSSPRFEGVHLRGGPIARGGLRWSDRPQDFRTEVLSLAKAQQVKNAIIVPQGAKGGFVPRNLPKSGSRDEVMAEGIACYRSFIANLLSVTDNLQQGEVVPPEDTVRLDNDDPYLVVAADKGTATFSDIANELAISKGFWLGDAFASGGSAGYDHKKMAITARGAWEAVKRHFREMGTDIQTTPFKVIGIGDMSGDVFGNGMLLSRQIKLIAAFDHRDIFIDPTPDTETSWQERKRLYELPRSSWQDYNRELISEGGGVFSRSAKSIPLSTQMQLVLGTTQKAASPAEIMKLLLKAQTDLLWFGGIGTYVRASAETDEQAGDRANDGIRVTASELQAKVIGEGANLGVTQGARIEFAMKGGRINTDAIDNSAGVNSSDMEVNIKIAMATALARQTITLDERNAILVQMTDEVAEKVLRNNYLQTLALSIAEARGLDELGFQARLMTALEATGALDRDIELLPYDAQIAERRRNRQPLTRPELAVLLAYAKIALYHELVGSTVVDDPYLSNVLVSYFPKSMRQRFHAEIESHPLRREIIATTLANTGINRGGSTMIARLKEETGRTTEDISYAFAAATGAFRLNEFHGIVDALDGKVDAERQMSLYLLTQDVLRRQTTWFLRYADFREGLSSLIERYRAGLDTLAGAIETIFDEWLIGRLEDAQARFGADDLPEGVARRFAVLQALTDGPDIILLAQKLGRPELDVARLFLRVSSHFRVDELRTASEQQTQGEYYDRLAVSSTLGAVASAQRAIVEKIFASAIEKPDFDEWRTMNELAVSRARERIDEILNGTQVTLAKLTVAVAHLRELAEI